MKITFIGSSHGVPEPHRKCTCIMIETGDNVYFIDMGAYAIDALRTRNISIDTVKGIFITHMHGDHTDGLIGFMNDVNCSRKCTPPVFLPVVEAGQVIRDWINVNLVHARPDLDFRQVKEGILLDDGYIRVTAYLNHHCYNAFSYLVEAEGKAVIFTGDLSRWPGMDFPKAETELPVVLAICEAAHGPITEYQPHFERLQPKLVCINHYSEYFLEGLEQLKQNMPQQAFALAKDGMVLEL